MSNILQIGFTTEGSTDKRFLSNIIQETFIRIAMDCTTEIDVYQPEHLKKEGNGFIEQIKNLATKYSYFHVICVHCDSDSPTIDDRMRNNITPAFSAVANSTGTLCKNLVAMIPVQMTEAWMLADIDLLKEKMNTKKTNEELELPTKLNQIENISNPKETIINALEKAQSELPRRRKKLTISNLYTSVSQEITFENLQRLPSFNKFVENAKEALRKLNYLS